MLKFIIGTHRRHDVTLDPRSIDAMNNHLIALRPFISRADFARRPRTFAEVPRWKATEYRMFLRYFGVPLLKLHVRTELFEHFLLFHCSVKILSNDPFCYEENDLAKEMLTGFVESSAVLYGKSFMCYNIHIFPHLAEDVKCNEPLDSFSAYE